MSGRNGRGGDCPLTTYLLVFTLLGGMVSGLIGLVFFAQLPQLPFAGVGMIIGAAFASIVSIGSCGQ